MPLPHPSGPQRSPTSPPLLCPFPLRLPPPLNRYSSPFPSSFSTDNLRPAPSSESRTFSHSVPPLSFPIYTMLFSQTDIPAFESFFFLFPFFCFFLVAKIFPSQQNNSTLVSRKINFARSWRRGRRRFIRFWFGSVSLRPLRKGMEGGREGNWSVARCVKTAWMKNTIDFSTLGDTASSLCIVTSFLGYIQNWPDISLNPADYVQVFEFDYRASVYCCVFQEEQRIAIVFLDKGQIGRAYTHYANGYRLFPQFVFLSLKCEPSLWIIINFAKVIVATCTTI